MSTRSDRHFSNSIPHFGEVIRWAQDQDVTELRSFLLTNPEMPLIGVSSGGASSPLVYATLLYSTFQGLARAVTPLTFASLSDAVIKNSKTLILSNSGHGVDPEYTSRRAFSLSPEHSACITRPGEKNDLIPIAERFGVPCFRFSWPEFECTGGFISCLSHIATYSLFYKAFTGDPNILGKISLSERPEDCFSYSTRVPGGELPSFDRYRHYIILYGGYGEPVATDLETKFHESGYASVQLADYRNFCHGRFIFESNHFDDTCIILLRTPREAKFADQLINAKGLFRDKSTGEYPSLFPADMPLLTIDTDLDSPLASLDLLVKSQVFFSEAGKAYGYDPANPENPKHIDKRGLRCKPFPGISKAALNNNF